MYDNDPRPDNADEIVAACDFDNANTDESVQMLDAMPVDGKWTHGVCVSFYFNGHGVEVYSTSGMNGTAPHLTESDPIYTTREGARKIYLALYAAGYFAGDDANASIGEQNEAAA